MKNGFKVLERAVSKGFDNLSKDTIPSDPDLKLYENMTPETLSFIADKYGADGMVKYVTAMEAKRIKKLQQGE